MEQAKQEMHWLERAALANAPFNDDNCPVLRLWRSLRAPSDMMPGLVLKSRLIRDSMVVLDAAPRHDTVLSDDELKKVHYNELVYPMSRAHNRLAQSLKEIDDAFESIDKIFRGDLKAVYYDRLARHRAEAQSLVALFSTVPTFSANQPCTIRQQIMASLYRQLSSVVELITSVRRSVNNDVLPGCLFDDLKTCEAELYRMRASVARWRDNPSQKLTAKMTNCYSRLGVVEESLKRMRQNAQFECQELGMIFGNRAGISRVERC